MKSLEFESPTILGDPDRIKALAADSAAHYEKRVEEGSTVKGKAMFVSSKREIAWQFFKEVIALRSEWNEIRECAEDNVARLSKLTASPENAGGSPVVHGEN